MLQVSLVDDLLQPPEYACPFHEVAQKCQRTPMLLAQQFHMGGPRGHVRAQIAQPRAQGQPLVLLGRRPQKMSAGQQRRRENDPGSQEEQEHITSPSPRAPPRKSKMP